MCSKLVRILARLLSSPISYYSCYSPAAHTCIGRLACLFAHHKNERRTTVPAAAGLAEGRQWSHYPLPLKRNASWKGTVKPLHVKQTERENVPRKLLMLVFVCEGTVSESSLAGGSWPLMPTERGSINGCGSVSVELYPSNWSYDFSCYNPI